MKITIDISPEEVKQFTGQDRLEELLQNTFVEAIKAMFDPTKHPLYRFYMKQEEANEN